MMLPKRPKSVDAALDTIDLDIGIGVFIAELAMSFSATAWGRLERTRTEIVPSDPGLI